MSRTRPLQAGLTLAWAAAVAAGFAATIGFEVAPGDAGDPPVSWPSDSALRRSPGLPELVMFLHPRCPCSRASLAELEKIMARCHGRLSALVILVTPPGAAEGWAGDGAQLRAQGIPGVTVVDDLGGVEARRFGAATSGETLLYDEDGALRFSGGITAARGHEGESRGSREVVMLVTAGADHRVAALVFGCPLNERWQCRR